MNVKDRILLKLKEMNEYVEELKDLLPDNYQGYENGLKERRACEKTIELALETVIDIVSMIVAHEKLGVPSSEDELVSLLAQKSLFSANMLSTVKTMKGFRNILVHKYGKVNNEKSYLFLTEELDDFTRFEKEVLKYLKERK